MERGQTSRHKNVFPDIQLSSDSLCSPVWTALLFLTTIFFFRDPFPGFSSPSQASSVSGIHTYFPCFCRLMTRGMSFGFPVKLFNISIPFAAGVRLTSSVCISDSDRENGSALSCLVMRETGGGNKLQGKGRMSVPETKRCRSRSCRLLLRSWHSELRGLPSRLSDDLKPV